MLRTVSQALRASSRQNRVNQGTWTPRCFQTASSPPAFRLVRNLATQTGTAFTGVQYSLGDCEISVSVTGISKRKVVPADILGMYTWSDVEFQDLAKNEVDSTNVCGDDAFITCQAHPKQNTSRVIVGVADGVGGWAEEGVDPSIVSHGLMSTLRSFFNKQLEPNSQHFLDNAEPVDIVEHCHMQYKAMQTHHYVAGTTTLCLGMLQHGEAGQLQLHSLNIGDSGLTIVHADENIPTWQSMETCDVAGSLRIPYQIGVVPDRFRLLGSYDNSARDGAEETFDVFPNDVIVFGSDGLYDNVSVGTIEKIVRHFNVSKLEKHAHSPTAEICASLLRAAQNGRKIDDIVIAAVHVRPSK